MGRVGVSASTLVLRWSQQALLHRHTGTRKTVFNFEGITFGSLCVCAAGTITMLLVQGKLSRRGTACRVRPRACVPVCVCMF